MQINEGFAQRKYYLHTPALNEKSLIAAVALAFLFLHVLAVTILQNEQVNKSAAPQEEAKYSSYD
jgi:hypothetical protein